MSTCLQKEYYKNIYTIVLRTMFGVDNKLQSKTINKQK